MCNLKQTPQSNWWSNDSTPLCDTTGLGMVLWLQHPPERGVETSHSLPSRGMLQYLPFFLRDKLPVALESTQLKPLLHQRGWQAASKSPRSLPGCPTWSHPRERTEGACSCGRASCMLSAVRWESAAEMPRPHHLSAHRVGTGRQKSSSCAPSEGVVASILCRDTNRPQLVPDRWQGALRGVAVGLGVGRGSRP